MNSKLLRSITAALLAAVLMMAPAGVSHTMKSDATPSASRAAQGDAAVKAKDEVVYANLAPDGSVHSVRVVNRFEVTAAGRVTDYGAYASAINLTGADPLTLGDGSVSFDAQAGNFYYQGNMTAADLPWAFDITYYMDGIETPPDALAGKSGKLEIRIATSKNAKADPAFYESYMLQISMALDGDKCGDIEAPGATIARAGKNVVIAHTVMPGKSADIAVSARVKDFEMDGIDISAMPFSMNIDLPDTGDMTDDFQALADAISDLNDGIGDLADGAAELKAGAGALKKGSSSIGQALKKLSGNSGQLIGASAQIDAALSQIAVSLGGSSGQFDPDELAQLPRGLAQLARGLGDISGGLTELKGGFIPAYGALAAAIQGIPDTPITQEEVAALYSQTDPSQHALLGRLVDSYAAGLTVTGTYGQVKDAFDAVGPAIDALSGSIDTIASTLEGMSASIEAALSGGDALDQLEQLISGLSALSENYAGFHEGLTAYMDGVDELAAGYAQFHWGVASLDNGVGGFHRGVEDLHGGTGTLKEETADMPGALQAEIDRLMDEYSGADFSSISFTSTKNENVALVQFVLKCDGIKEEGRAAAVPEAPKNDTFWDRFIALFGGKRQ